jgi:ABC-type dipeptide/oligopeptide/nickel transport system ATPase component
MIFQDPRAHINPVRRIGDFMTGRCAPDPCRSAGPRPTWTLGQVGIGTASGGCASTHELSAGCYSG